MTDASTTGRMSRKTAGDDIREDLAETIRSHYDRLERIADDEGRPGDTRLQPRSSARAMPNTPKGRSGDLGEILATELVEEEIGLRVPCAGSATSWGWLHMAMRGDDFIGAGYQDNKLWLLKGEAKSNQKLGKNHGYRRAQGPRPRQWPLHA